jgi:hypothetical protein
MRCTITLRRIGPAVALLVQLANFTLSFLILRWLLLDHRKRCPVCVSAPVQRTGWRWPLQTFLEWCGSDLGCYRRP